MCKAVDVEIAVWSSRGCDAVIMPSVDLRVNTASFLRVEI